MSDGANDLLVHGIAAVKAGDTADARRYLERALDADPDSEQRIDIWYWLSEVSAGPEEERRCLEQILTADPFELRARRKLAILDGRLDPADIVDPDRLPAAPPPPDADPKRFLCPNCGGRMTYSPDGRSLQCESCQSRQRFQSGQNPNAARPDPEHDFLIAMATARGHLNPQAARTLSCQGCGASFLLPPETLSLDCPYCGSAYVIATAATRDLIAPAGVIPFSVTEAAAAQAVRSRPHGRPQKSSLKPGTLRGVYLPAWCFDVTGHIRWKCMRYENREWVPDTGFKMVLIGGLLVAAAPRLREWYPAGVQGYKLSGLEPFDQRYLASWPAETYQVPAGQASLDARVQALAASRDQLSHAFLSRVKDLTLDSSGLIVDTFKLVLLPAWFASLDNGEAVLVNGQTGEMRE